MMELRSRRRRKAVDFVVKAVSAASGLVGLLALVWILYTVIRRGFGAINFEFFTSLPTPPGISGGGLANAILGTVAMTLLAAVIALPIGILGGVYLSEFGKGSLFADFVRFLANVLVGVPSIIIGVFIYGLIVLPMKAFSGFAGAAALAVIMLPIIVRTTEDMLNLVPDALRESALAMGASRRQAVFDVVFRTARSGLITGVLLSVARVSGETAPLLFTALNSPYWFKSLSAPIANLTVTIFNYAMSPYADWQQQAWGASLLIMLGILALNIFVRMMFKPRHKS